MLLQLEQELTDNRIWLNRASFRAFLDSCYQDAAEEGTLSRRQWRGCLNIIEVNAGIRRRLRPVAAPAASSPQVELIPAPTPTSPALPSLPPEKKPRTVKRCHIQGEWYPVKEAAHVLGVPEGLVRNAIRNKAIPFRREGYYRTQIDINAARNYFVPPVGESTPTKEANFWSALRLFFGL